jgi:tetratricopeptide (TPR) repeat protein
VAEESRIDGLRRRLQKDPGSIAFAQLAEEYRRAGRYRDALETCQAGLAKHPGYLSARVTYGRALIEVNDIEGAQRELATVLRVAPENLSAIRGLAEIHRRRGELPEAIDQFKTAFELAGRDPAIDQIVRDLRRDVVARNAPVVPGAAGAPVAPVGGASTPAARPPVAAPASLARPMPPGPLVPERGAALPPGPLVPARPPVDREPAEQVRARRTVAYLERWLGAIVADRRTRLYGAHA